MSAAALTRPPAIAPPRPRVELRKMTDTRAGFWLLLAIVAAHGRSSSCRVLVSARPRTSTCATMLSIAVQPAGILLPIVGILLVTSEWSQRTALITFALVPERWRVLRAKLLAAIALALAAMALSRAGGRARDGDRRRERGTPRRIVWQRRLPRDRDRVGVAFGAALLASAPAIVCYFVLPISWSLLGSLTPFRGAADWLDGGQTLAPLTDHVISSGEWQRAPATLALWMVVPALIGAARIIRGGDRVAFKLGLSDLGVVGQRRRWPSARVSASRNGLAG